MNAPQALARATDPSTSYAAAETVNVTALEARVLRALRNHIVFPFGATTPQLAEYLNLPLVTVSPRLRPMVNKQVVKDSGTRLKGASGRRQIVWVRA